MHIGCNFRHIKNTKWIVWLLIKRKGEIKPSQDNEFYLTNLKCLIYVHKIMNENGENTDSAIKIIRYTSIRDWHCKEWLKTIYSVLEWHIIYSLKNLLPETINHKKICLNKRTKNESANHNSYSYSSLFLKWSLSKLFLFTSNKLPDVQWIRVHITRAQETRTVVCALWPQRNYSPRHIHFKLIRALDDHSKMRAYVDFSMYC